MNSDFLVSIIIPSYNSEQYIADTLQCVAEQTWQNWECIIVDDGSTDNSVDIVLSFISNDKRFNLIKQVKKGAPAARNTGIQNAHGSFIMFLDSDDLIARTKLSSQLEVFNTNDEIGIVFCDGYCFTKHNNRYDLSDLPVPTQKDFGFIPYKQMYRKLFFANRLTIHAALIKKELLLKFGGFREDLFYHEDHELWIRMAKNGVNFYSMTTRHVFYRQNTVSMSSNKVNMKIGEQRTLSINRDLSLISKRAIRAKEQDLYKWLIRDLLRAKRNNEAKPYLKYYIRECTQGKCPYLLRAITLWIRVYITKR